jgi:hypothetical protein
MVSCNITLFTFSKKSDKTIFLMSCNCFYNVLLTRKLAYPLIHVF